MIAHHIKIALRNLAKRKWISLTHLAGLSVGMAVCLLISLWIWDEISFDRVHENYENIARVRLNVTSNGEIRTTKTVPLPLVQELRSNFGNDFQYIVPSSHRLVHILSASEKKLMQKGVYLGSGALSMLSLNMIKGDASALTNPRSVVLSAAAAHIFFGGEDPLGKVMIIDNKQNVTVAGVYEDLPDNSTFADIAFIAPFDLYISEQTWITNLSDPWNQNPIQLYVQLKGTSSFEQVSGRIKNVVQRKGAESGTGKKSAVLLEPMSKWHLYNYKNGSNQSGAIRYVKMFAWIAAFVLLLACFNFMNLSTARSEQRAKEVGIRKTLGSLRSQLITQFFAEAVLLSLFAFGCAILLAQLALPFFNEVAGKKMSIFWSNGYFWIAGGLFSLLTGLLAGSYPALYLSSFNAMNVLKRSFRSSGNAPLFRKSLIVVQFAVAVTMMIGTVVVFRQVQYAKQRPTGYDPKNLLLIPMTTDDIPQHFDAVRTDLLKSGAITAMAASESTTTDIWGTDSDITWPGKDPRTNVDFPNTGVTVEYGKTVGWTFIDGRDFSSGIVSDSAGFILNEAAVKYMGLQHPVGEIIRWKERPFTVIGVIKDMVVESPYEPVKPSIYCLARGHDNFAILKLNTAVNTSKALSEIEKVFRRYSPSSPFAFEFIDDSYGSKFSGEERVGKIAGCFTAIAIFISCLGIFAIATFMAERRSKEIGIRKVFGASVWKIWQLLSREFSFLIVLSLLIAIPAAYFLMNNWLQNYHYRTTIDWWIPAIIAASAICIMLMTVSFQTIRAALAKPINTLRDE
jgi:ABC-type antimicrobial peptide transport system permease subunit